MVKGLGFGKRRLINQIIMQNWNLKSPEEKKFNYNELLYIMQEMFEEEGKHYLEGGTTLRGHQIFRDFVKHLMFRNIANYDSMVLVTSEKGCITGDALLEVPRDLTKYPKGIPLKELDGKGPILVYSFNVKTKQFEVKESDGVEFVKEDDVYEVELINGQKLKATADHPFLLTDGTYKQLKDLLFCNIECQNGGLTKSVKYLGKKKVYDVVNVKDNHNFIVNGFVVSNTGKSSAAIMKIGRASCRERV